jgi:uncharacterized protein YutE (UPF0331/DUF86 family)
MLGDVGALPSQFAEEIKPIAGFRNILVHGYMDIDERKVFENLRRGLKDFPRFAGYITSWMEKQGLL